MNVMIIDMIKTANIPKIFTKTYDPEVFLKPGIGSSVRQTIKNPNIPEEKHFHNIPNP